MRLGVLVIGSELLTGKRRDAQLPRCIESLGERFPQVRLSCLAHMEGEYRETELGLRGEAAAVDSALDWLVGEVERGGWTWERKR